MKHLLKVAPLCLPAVVCFGVLAAETAARQLNLTLLQTISDGGGDARLTTPPSIQRRIAFTSRAATASCGRFAQRPGNPSGGVRKARPHSAAIAGWSSPEHQRDSDTATLFDGTSGKVRAQIGTGQKPDGAVFDPASGLSSLWMQGRYRHADRPGALPTRQAGSRSEASWSGCRGRPGSGLRQRRNRQRDCGDRHGATKSIDPLSSVGCDGPTAWHSIRTKAFWWLLAAIDWPVSIRANDGKQLSNVPIDRHPDAVIFDASRKSS